MNKKSEWSFEEEEIYTEKDFKGEEIYKGYYIFPFDGYYDVHYASEKFGVDYMFRVGKWFVSCEEAYTLFPNKAQARAWITEQVKLDKLIGGLGRWAGVGVGV